MFGYLKKIYYDYLPDSLRKYYGPKVETLHSLLCRLYAVVSDLYMPVAGLNVSDSKQQTLFNMLTVGRGDISPFLLEPMKLSGSCTIARTRQRKIGLWNIPRLDRTNTHVLLVEADRCFTSFLASKGYIPIPKWVYLTLDLSLPPDEIIKRFKKRNWNNYRRMEKQEYSYDVVHGADRIEHFYHRMYVPFVTSRHGERAYIESFAYMKNLMQYGELLFVKHGGEYVGGFMFNTAYDTPQMAYRGVLNGNNDHISKGISSAMYCFAIDWAKEKGYSNIDFGHCRPFLDDGVLQFKRRWGMHVHKSPRLYRSLFLLLGEANDAISDFFLNNPVVYQDHHQLKGLLFSAPDTLSDAEAIEARSRKYQMPGLTGFTVRALNSPPATP